MSEQTQFMVLDGKDLDTIGIEQVARLLVPVFERLGYLVKTPTGPRDEASTGPVTEIPIKETPKPVAGHPRRQVGTRLDNGVLHGIFVGTGMPGLLEVVSQPGEPDAYVDRAYNLPYDSLPGVSRPTGPETFWGLDPVPGASRQAGYRQCFFNADGRAYWQQADLPDEAVPTPVSINPTITSLGNYGLQ